MDCFACVGEFFFESDDLLAVCSMATDSEGGSDSEIASRQRLPRGRSNDGVECTMMKMDEYDER